MSVFVGEPSSGNRGSEQKDMGLPHVAWLRKQVFKQHPAPGAKPSEAIPGRCYSIWRQTGGDLAS